MRARVKTKHGGTRCIHILHRTIQRRNPVLNLRWIDRGSIFFNLVASGSQISYGKKILP
ncbi:MAG: hypothetical protein ACI9BW_004801, partial [Gammaproteobacteria bacterium]